MHAACIVAIENDALGYGISDLVERLKGASMKEETHDLRVRVFSPHKTHSYNNAQTNKKL